MSDPAHHLSHLQSLDAARDAMIERLVAWCEINSGSHHRAGLERMREVLVDAFSELAPVSASHEEAIHLSCRPDAPTRVLLLGHYDTVYGADHPFQRCTRLDENTLRGPGTADMKGGLLVLLEALRAFERYPGREAIGWEVFLTADEEIGSPHSSAAFAELADRCHLGLVYEPALPGGELARARPGSALYTATARGKAAHVGRDFAAGRNAIVALGDALARLHRLNDESAGTIFNAGHIEGGGPVNVVPETARADCNVRVRRDADADRTRAGMEETAAAVRELYGVELDWEGGFTRPAKEITPAIESLFADFRTCAAALGIDLSWRDTGGCCDGNDLAAAGLPNLDSLGVRGGRIHSDEEFAALDSLTERAKLSSLFLMNLAENGLRRD